MAWHSPFAVLYESPFPLQYYALLWLVFLAEIVVVVMIFVFYYAPDVRKKLNLYPEDALKDAMKKYGLVNDEDMQNLIDNMQKTVSDQIHYAMISRYLQMPKKLIHYYIYSRYSKLDWWYINKNKYTN